MNLLKLTMVILYRYYAKGGTRRIPYFSALCGVVLLIYLHIFQLLIVFNKVDEVLPMNNGDTRITRYWKLALFLLPVFLVVRALVKPSDVREANYTEATIKRGGIFLIIYATTSFILLFVLAFIFLRR